MHQLIKDLVGTCTYKISKSPGWFYEVLGDLYAYLLIFLAYANCLYVTCESKILEEKGGARPLLYELTLPDAHARNTISSFLYLENYSSFKVQHSPSPPNIFQLSSQLCL
jgi:hypothetical protein